MMFYGTRHLGRHRDHLGRWLGTIDAERENITRPAKLLEVEIVADIEHTLERLPTRSFLSRT